MYSLDDTGQIVMPTPGARGRCRGCDGETYAKCGQLVTWHWAHRSGECDAWAERDSSWHLAWQSHAPPDRVEVTIGSHRADMLGPDGTIVEVQHSYLSVPDIIEREKHYGNMIWIFDARDAFIANRLGTHTYGTGRGKFTWERPRKSILACQRPVYLDLGESLFRIDRMEKAHFRDSLLGSGRVFPLDSMRRWLATSTGPPIEIWEAVDNCTTVDELRALYVTHKPLFTDREALVAWSAKGRALRAG